MMLLLGAGASACATVSDPPPPDPALDARAWEEAQLEACRTEGDLPCLYLAKDWPYAQGEQRERMAIALGIACDRGSVEGCATLGGLLKQDQPAKSADAFERACVLGALVECTKLYLQHGVPERRDSYDPERALRAVEAGCARGERSLCGNVLDLERRTGVPPSPERTDRTMARLHCEGDFEGPTCRKKVALAYAGLDGVYGGVIDLGRARSLFAELCDEGDLPACHSEAALAWRGGGHADRERALERLTRACDGGVGPACFLLGRIALVKGRTYDPERATAYFEQGCGTQWGCVQEAGLRLAYKAEWKWSAKLLEKACLSGEDSACGALGRVFVISGRRQKDALALLDRACTQRDEAACRAAAYLCSRPGASKNQAQAARYRKMAFGPDSAKEPLTTTMKRSLRGQGSKEDDRLTGLVVIGTLILPAWPVVFAALDSPAEGFGFEHYGFADP